MKRAEAEKLLGGYATGTLTEAERRLLFEAALADQELFEALADEEALRELLTDPRVRRRLLAALAEREAGLWERLLAWWRRPWAWGVAGSVAVAALLVVMLLPVYQATKTPVVQPVAQAPVEAAKPSAPAVAAPAQVEVAKRARPPAPSAAPPALGELATSAEPTRTAPAPPPVREQPREQAAAVAEQRAAERAEEKQVLAEAEAKSKLEAAPGGVAGGVVGGIAAPAPQMAALEASQARALYYGPAAERKEAAPMALRARRAADVATAPSAPTGVRYSVEKLGAEGRYAEVAPGTVFAKGDVIRLSVEANHSGVLRLTRQDSRGTWNRLGEVAVQARMRQVIPAEGLRLEGPLKLALEFTRAQGRAVALEPLVHKAADERAVYVVAAGGGDQVRAEIDLAVR